jgi:hypothetical protein
LVDERLSKHIWQYKRLGFSKFIQKELDNDSRTYVVPGFGRARFWVQIKYTVYFTWSNDDSIKYFTIDKPLLIRFNSKLSRRCYKDLEIKDLQAILCPFLEECKSL